MVFAAGARPVLILGGSRPDATKTPEPVSADRPYTFSKVIGRSIPIVVGTGKVDGIPIIGGAVTTQAITGYNQFPNSVEGAIAAGGSGFDQALDSFPPGSKYTSGDAFSATVDVPVYGTQQTAMIGYLLAFDPFGDGYQLVRLEVNDTVVYDAENGIGASTTFRFYGGNHTAVDPIATTNIGANAGAWQHFAIVYLSGFASTSAPSVKAVISNAATAGGGTHQIAWTGTVPTTYSENSAGRQVAYDPTQNVLYQLFSSVEIPGLPQVYLAVLDAQTYTERYRIPLAGSAPYVGGFMWIMAIRGSGFVLVRYPGIDFVYDVVTGAVVSSHTETGGENFDWKIGFPFGDTYIVTGFDFGPGSGLPYAQIDLLGNLSIGRVTGSTGGDLVYGRSGTGAVSFFACSSSGTVKESIFNGDFWVTNTVYTSAGVPTGAWYDPQTGYLVVFETVSGTYHIRYVNPDTGVTIDSVTVTKAYYIATGTFATGRERYWPSPGYVMMTDGTSDPGIVYLLNIATKAITTFAQDSSVDELSFTTGIFDQTKQVYFKAYGTTHWTEYQLPSILPGAMNLSDIITKISFLSGYGPSELTFEGFTGLQAYGFVIDQDTNVRTALQAVSDIYGFSFCDTGSSFYFKKPGRDTSFALDATLSAGDMVFGDKSAIDSTDEAAIRSTMRVQLDYISKDQGYTSATVSFQMAPVTNSLRTDKYSTPLTLSDADAQKFVTDKYFELQAKLRTHAFSLTGKVEFLPGDVVSIPSGLITYTVQVDSIDLNRNMVADIQVMDFQTAVQTTITPVTNSGLDNAVPISLATQYIHLDVPLYRYGDDLAGAGLRQYGILASRGQQNWGGGALYRGDTASSLSALLTQAPHNAVIATCTTVLGNPLDPFGTTDASTVTIRRTSGDVSLLVNHTEAEVLAGANFAYIGAKGRWEAVGYKTVTANPDGSYTLSGFSRRGYRGTEVFCDTHQVGDQFIMVAPAWLKSVNQPVSDLGLSKYYKAIGLTQDPSTGSVVQKQILGAAETPYACVNLNAVAGTPDGIDLSWDYRSRLADGTNPANFGETTLSFEIDIYNGATYKRTLTTATGSVHYAHADVLTDFGSDPPAEITFDVFMMSTLPILVPNQTRAGAGRGYRARAHVVLVPGSMTADNAHITADSTFYKADAA